MQVTLDCLHQMFDSAKDIMQWLSLCARVVAKADKPVQWTTPLGLPVVQPYRKKVNQHSARHRLLHAVHGGIMRDAKTPLLLSRHLKLV
jgi:DNA-directed RNA polymerase